MRKTVFGYKLIFNYIGIFLILIGMIILMPLILVIFKPLEMEYLSHFLIPGAFSILIGILITILYKKYEKGRLEKHQDAVLVVFIWLTAIFVSSFPFILTGDYNFTQSIFETTSGYSTTGFTIVDVEQTPDIFLLYRSLLQFFGGVGLILVLMSAMSDRYGMKLYNAEGHSDKLMPNLIRSARTILSIYIGYIIIGTAFYVFFGMPLFDAINHSISSVATGGFSTKAQSIGAYDSLGIEIVTIILMLLGATNFLIHLLLIRGKFKTAFKHIELKLLGLLMIIVIPFMIYSILISNQYDFWHSVRVGVFHFVSTITTTGLHIIPTVNTLPQSVLFVTIILMMIGACVGSTAGGMKLYRVGLAMKSMFWSLRDSLGHRKIIRTHFIDKLGSRVVVEKEDINVNNTFLTVYLCTLFLGILIFTLHGYDVYDSIFEFTSILGTIGLSVGIIQYGSPSLILWTGIVGMLIARLESYVIIVAIVKVFIDIQHKFHKRTRKVK